MNFNVIGVDLWHAQTWEQAEDQIFIRDVLFTVRPSHISLPCRAACLCQVHLRYVCRVLRLWCSNQVQGFSRHGYRLYPNRRRVEHRSYETLWCFSSHTDSFCKHQPTNEYQSACGETEDLFMCQQSQQRTQTPVLYSLITPSAIISTFELCKVSSEPGNTTKHFISISQHKALLLLQCTLVPGGHVLLALRGRQPLCGTGVLSVIDTTSRPPIVKPLIADCTTEKNTFIYLKS